MQYHGLDIAIYLAQTDIDRLLAKSWGYIWLKQKALSSPNIFIGFYITLTIMTYSKPNFAYLLLPLFFLSSLIKSSPYGIMERVPNMSFSPNFATNYNIEVVTNPIWVSVLLLYDEMFRWNGLIAHSMVCFSFIILTNICWMPAKCPTLCNVLK